jgi:hypothetical protein
MILPRFFFDADVREFRSVSQNAAPEEIARLTLIEAIAVPDFGRGGAGLRRIKASDIRVFPWPICSAIIPHLTSMGFVTVSSPKMGLK